MVKRFFISLLLGVLLLVPVSLSVSAVGEAIILNYPIYDMTSLNGSNPVLLAPNGLSFKGFNLTIGIKNGMIGVPTSTFNSAVSNGNITVFDDSNPVTALPDDFTTPPIYSSMNLTQELAPRGVVIHKNSSTYQFYIRPTGVWTCNPSSFNTYRNSPNFEVLTEPVTEPPEEPTTEEPTTEEPPEDRPENNTYIVRSSILMGFALYVTVSLIGYGIWKSVHLFYN